MRLIVAVGVGVVLLLCLGGVGVIVSLYDSATAIKRTAPDAVVDSFLRAYLVDRSDQEASLYTCKSGIDLSQIRAYRNDVQNREKTFSVGIRITWSKLDVTTNGKSAVVATILTKTTTDQSGRLANPWRFNLVDENGWRVCGASQTG